MLQKTRAPNFSHRPARSDCSSSSKRAAATPSRFERFCGATSTWGCQKAPAPGYMPEPLRGRIVSCFKWVQVGSILPSAWPSRPLDLPRHLLHHLLDREVRSVDEDVGVVSRQGRIAPGAVAQVAAADVLFDAGVGDGAGRGLDLFEAAAEADVGAGVEGEYVGRVREEAGADAQPFENGSETGGRLG